LNSRPFADSLMVNHQLQCRTRFVNHTPDFESDDRHEPQRISELNNILSNQVFLNRDSSGMSVEKLKKNLQNCDQSLQQKSAPTAK
jgi:hypothetical protein